MAGEPCGCRIKNSKSAPVKRQLKLSCLETDAVPAVEYFSKYSKYNSIELDGGQAVEAAQQELLLKVAISD
jgi:hypothetical protein